MRFNYKNANIYYTDNEQGNQAVVFIHGFLENSTMWEPFLNTFSQAYRVISIDLLGHGNSESIGYIHTMDDQADMVIALLKNLSINTISLIGHSMGGYVCLSILNLYPDFVNKICLINSSPFKDTDQRKKLRERAIEVYKKEYNKALLISIEGLFSRHFKRSNQTTVKSFITQAQLTPLRGAIAAQLGMSKRKDHTLTLIKSTIAKLVIQGDQDPIVPHRKIEQLLKGQCELVTLNSGHMSPVENTEQLKKLMATFLKKNT